MLKIDELVQWDMEFGVTIGPAGYDHRLRCPYCGKRMLLSFHEGGRDRSGIRIAYACESCGSHSLISFTPPGHRFDVPEASFGERMVVAKPMPVPPDPVAPRQAAGQPRKDKPPTTGRNQGTTPPGASGTTAQGAVPSQSHIGQSQTPQRQQQPRNQQRPQGSGDRSATQGQASSGATQHTRQQSAAGGQRPAPQQPSPGRDASAASSPRPSGQQTRPVAPPPTPPAARSAEIQDISETVQEQADKASSKAPPYRRRRRRPFRPPGSK